MHILLVEDNPLVAEGIVAGLRLHDYSVSHVNTASSASAAIKTTHFDIGILDLGLPDEDGISLLTRWRLNGCDLPILILTARDAIHHRIKGLQSGADDYLIKPFDLDELIARLQALLRRAAGRSLDSLEWGDLTIIPSTGEVLLDRTPVELSRRELALLQVLLQYPRQILTSNQLQDSVYGFEQEVESNAINVHIYHLRRKLGVDIIETVRGQGYRLGKRGNKS